MRPSAKSASVKRFDGLAVELLKLTVPVIDLPILYTDCRFIVIPEAADNVYAWGVNSLLT